MSQQTRPTSPNPTTSHNATDTSSPNTAPSPPTKHIPRPSAECTPPPKSALKYSTTFKRSFTFPSTCGASPTASHSPSTADTDRSLAAIFDTHSLNPSSSPPPPPPPNREHQPSKRSRFVDVFSKMYKSDPSPPSPVPTASPPPPRATPSSTASYPNPWAGFGPRTAHSPWNAPRWSLYSSPSTSVDTGASPPRDPANSERSAEHAPWSTPPRRVRLEPPPWHTSETHGLLRKMALNRDEGGPRNGSRWRSADGQAWANTSWADWTWERYERLVGRLERGENEESDESEIDYSGLGEESCWVGDDDGDAEEEEAAESTTLLQMGEAVRDGDGDAQDT